MSEVTVEITTPAPLEFDIASSSTIEITVDTSAQSAASSGFNYVQVSPSDEWIVNHNLGYKPNVQMFTAGGVIMLGEIIHISNNQTRIYFNIPLAGSARFS